MEMNKNREKKHRGRKKWIILAAVCILLLIGAMEEVSSSEEDLIGIVGLTEEQAWKVFGEPDRRESAGGVRFGYYDEGFNYGSRLDGTITVITLTGGRREMLGISLGDSEDAVNRAVKRENLLLESQDMVTEDGQQMLKLGYRKRVGETDYLFIVYLDEDYRVKKIFVIAKGK